MANNLKILFLNSVDPAVWGGLENWMELCGTGLRRRGHAVWYAGRAGSLFLKRIEAHQAGTVIPLDISGDFHPTAIGQIAGLTSQLAIDLVLGNLVKDIRLAGLARRFSRKYRIVWTPGVNLAKRTLSHRLLFSRFVDHVIVPSQWLQDEIISSGFIGRERFSAIPIGLDETEWQEDRETARRFLRQRFNLPAAAFVYLTSGRFVKQKGHTYLIEAVRPLADKHPDMFWVLLGEGPLQHELMKQIREYRLTDRFVFCGLLDVHRRVVFGADLSVHPAVVEPYGIVLVEAMAAGLPVIASRVGGIPEIAKDGESAILVNPADPAALTSAMELLYTDRRRRQDLGEAGQRRFLARFRLDMMIDRIEETLRMVTGG